MYPETSNSISIRLTIRLITANPIRLEKEYIKQNSPYKSLSSCRLAICDDRRRIGLVYLFEFWLRRIKRRETRLPLLSNCVNKCPDSLPLSTFYSLSPPVLHLQWNNTYQILWHPKILLLEHVPFTISLGSHYIFMIFCDIIKSLFINSCYLWLY